MSDKLDIFQQKKILLGVTGGIAAFKAVDLASKLTKHGASVTTVMTENACKLIGPKSFEAITGNPVLTTMWNSPEEYKITHIDVRENNDAVVVAPATANIIAKMANGICDDLLSTTLCACWNNPVLFAPAMNNMMWNNPAVQRNLSLIKNEFGVRTIGPESGRLACGSDDIGRMSEPEDILDALAAMLCEKAV